MVVQVENKEEKEDECHLKELNYWLAFGQEKDLFFSVTC